MKRSRLRTVFQLLLVVLLCFIVTGASRYLNEADNGRTPISTPREYFGLHIHHLLADSTWPTIPFGSWRLWDAGVTWAQLQPAPDRWEFTALDKYVAQAKAHNVDVLLPLAMTPKWASAGSNETEPPTDLNNWRNYVRTVALRYKGLIHNFEIWNEVNEPEFFSGSLESLVELTCTAYRELKTVDNTNFVLAPSVIARGIKPVEFQMKFLDSGGKNCIDGIADHFYVPVSSPEEMVAQIIKVRQALATRHLSSIPLWNTETGWRLINGDGTKSLAGINESWTLLNLEQSSAYVARALILARAAGIDRFYWYDWDSTSMGLREPAAKTVKPAGLSYAAVERWLTSSKLRGCRKDAFVWVCDLISSNGDTSWIVWTEIGTRTWTPPITTKPLRIEQAGRNDTWQYNNSTNIVATEVPTLVTSKDLR